MGKRMGNEIKPITIRSLIRNEPNLRNINPPKFAHSIKQPYIFYRILNYFWGDLVHFVNPFWRTFSEVTEYVWNKNKFLCTFQGIPKLFTSLFMIYHWVELDCFQLVCWTCCLYAHTVYKQWWLMFCLPNHSFNDGVLRWIISGKEKSVLMKWINITKHSKYTRNIYNSIQRKLKLRKTWK